MYRKHFAFTTFPFDLTLDTEGKSGEGEVFVA